MRPGSGVHSAAVTEQLPLRETPEVAGSGGRVAARVKSSEAPNAGISEEASPTAAARVLAPEPRSPAGFGATARARPLAGARVGQALPPKPRVSSWQIGGVLEE